MPSQGTMKLIAERGWLALLLIGALFAIAGLTGKVPLIGGETSQFPLQVTSFVFGLALMALGALFLWKWETINRNDQKTRTADLNPEAYKFRVTSQIPSNIAPPIKIEGRLSKKVPSGMQLWVVNKSDRGYYPQRNFKPKGSIKQQTWSYDYSPPAAYKDGDVRTLEFYLVGLDGQRLFQAWRALNRHFATPEKPDWEPLPILTTDCVPLCEEIKFSLKGSTPEALVTKPRNRIAGAKTSNASKSLTP